MAIYFLHIDWNIYFRVLFFLLAIYWLLIIFFLYKKQPRSIAGKARGNIDNNELKGSSSIPHSSNNDGRQASLFMDEPSEAELEGERQELDRSRLVYSLSDEIKHFMEEAGVKKKIGRAHV